MDFPAPRHLSVKSTPLLEHTPLWHEKFANSQQSAQHYNQDVREETLSKLSMLGASDYIVKHVEAYFNNEQQLDERIEYQLPDLVNHTLDEVDCYDTVKMSPSGSVSIGMDWHTLTTPMESAIINADFCGDDESVLAHSKLETLFDISGVHHPPVELEQEQTDYIDISTRSADELTQTFDDVGGVVWSHHAPIGYDCAGRGKTKSFLKKENYDPRGTVLILPGTVDITRFGRTVIGKGFVKIRSGFDSYNRAVSLINRGFNCVTADSALGALCLLTVPTVNFAERLFVIKRGIHIKNPQNIRVDLLLWLLYFQSNDWLTLFRRIQWRIGYVVEEVEWAYPNG